MPTVEKKRYRYSRAPVTDQDDKEIFRHWRKLRDVELQILLACYEHEPTSAQLASLIGRSLDRTNDLTRVLKRPPNDYISLTYEQIKNKKNYLSDWQRFRITRAGKDALIQRIKILPPLFPRSHSPEHEEMIDEGMLSLKIGLREHPEVEPIWFLDFLRMKNVPHSEFNRNPARWHYFPVSLPTISKDKVFADTFPVGVKRPFDDEGMYPFFIFEFERGTNKIDPAELDRSSVATKIACWLQVLQEEIYDTHLGLPQPYIVFISSGEPHAESVLNAIRKYVPEDYQDLFLVKVAPYEKLSRANKQRGVEERLPTGWMLTTDFLRTTRPFNICTSPID